MSKKIIVRGQYYKRKLKRIKSNGSGINNLTTEIFWGTFKNIETKRTLILKYRD